MTSVLSLLTSSVSSALPLVGKATDLNALAKSTYLETLTIYARQHPQDRSALETAMIKAGRTSDVSAMSEALKKDD